MNRLIRDMVIVGICIIVISCAPQAGIRPADQPASQLLTNLPKIEDYDGQEVMVVGILVALPAFRVLTHSVANGRNVVNLHFASGEVSSSRLTPGQRIEVTGFLRAKNLKVPIIDVSRIITPRTLTRGQTMSEQAIARILPTEYAAYEQALTGDHGLNDARASIALLSKVKETLGRSLSSHSQEQDSISAYRATWRLCLRTMRESNDQAAQKLIIDEWNKSLRLDSDATPSQVYALSEQWDRKLLSDDFWRLLRQTNNKKTVSAICYVLYVHGNQDDAKRLADSHKPGTQNAVNYMNYRLSGDTSPGPAAAPPQME